MADSALALLPDTFITGLKGASALEKFKEASEMPKVILASTKSRATPLYKSLSLSFKGRLAFALVSALLPAEAPVITLWAAVAAANPAIDGEWNQSASGCQAMKSDGASCHTGEGL